MSARPIASRNLCVTDPVGQSRGACIRIDAYRWGRPGQDCWTYALEFDPGPGPGNTRWPVSFSNLTRSGAIDRLVAHGWTRTGSIGLVERVTRQPKSANTNC